MNLTASPVQYQSGDMYNVTPGWLSFPPEQVSTLQRYGLPSEAQADRQRADDRAQNRAAVWPLVGLTAVLLSLGIAYRLMSPQRGGLAISHVTTGGQSNNTEHRKGTPTSAPSWAAQDSNL